MVKNPLFQNKVHLQKFSFDENSEVEIVLDKSFANFGTKLRKAKGILEYLNQNDYKGVFLTGDPNSNYMAAFSTFFHLSGLKVHSVFYSSSGYKNINHYIAEKHSHEVFRVKSKLEISNVLNKLHHPDFYLVPTFGMTKEAFTSLNSLWEKVDFSSYSHFALEIGSGLTLLSLLEYFKKKKIESVQIIGIAIGLRMEKIRVYLSKISEYFLNHRFDFSRMEILDPVKYPGFGKTGPELWEYCSTMVKKGVFLEPIYSGKSLLSLEEYLKNNQNTRKVGYLHQGGLPPSITRFQI